MTRDAPPLERPAPKRPRVLVVDDQLAMAEMLADGLSERGYDAVPEASSREAARRLASEPFDALVTDLRMAGVDGLELLEVSKRAAPARPVLVMTAYSAVDSAVESIRRGAYHYLTKPFKVDELALFLGRAIDESELRRETASLRKAFRDQFSMSGIVSTSDAMREVIGLAMRVADTNAPVLLLGETGTGKGMLARAIHAESARASAPFVTVNCAALPEQLLESELFGHVKGAFTGATSNRVGLFEEASSGALFLDEIGELSLALQAKLLDVLERSVVRAVGSNKERPIDVRIFAATHRDLRARVAAGAFREDLLYRLEVVTLLLPPLRHRLSDVPVLAEHFLRRSRARNPRAVVEGFSPEAMGRLLSHSWPGNVRELEHVVERVVLLGRTRDAQPADLPETVGAKKTVSPSFGTEVLPLREMQRRYVSWAYAELGSRKLLTAEKLGIDDKTLAKWLAREPEGEGE
jgi:two-component system, NtrC family, response regulator HydG